MDTVFTPEIQNQMFTFYANEVIDGKSQEGKRSALRSTWMGLKSASDQELDVMISELENGTLNLGAGSSSTGRYNGSAGGVQGLQVGEVTSAMPPTEATRAPVQQPTVTTNTPTTLSEARRGAKGSQDGGDSGQTDSGLLRPSQSLSANVKSAKDNASSDIVELLREIGKDPANVPYFETQAELDDAKRNNLVKRGDTVMVGDIMQVVTSK
jgi:hypothetical protein